MTEIAASGRHRAPGRHNPLTELTGMVAKAGHHGVKASAVAAASGGLVAAFALPAQAASAAATTGTQKAAFATAGTQGLAFIAAPALGAKPAAQPAADLASASSVAVSAPAAVVAPEVVSPAAAAPVAIGVTGVEAVEKPAPPPPPPPVVAAAAPATQNAPAQAAAAPAPPANVAASVGGGVLGVAAAYSGIWYVYGGSTPAGFDCSGYTSFVFRQVGISLPRTADAQRNFATPVANPQPGDLVFFGAPAYHVGIYAGNGMMYDSPRTGTQSGLHSIWTSDVTYGRV